MKTLTFTGHRCSYFYNIYNIQDEVYKPIIDVIDMKIKFYIENKNVNTFISGGALGIDMISFFCVHKLKQKYPNIKNILALPFIKQGENWSQVDKHWLDLMKQLADDVVYVDTLPNYKIGNQGMYNPKKLQKRNEYMIDNSDYLLALWSGNNSGTKNCISYAFSKNIDIDFIYLVKEEEDKGMKIIKNDDAKELQKAFAEIECLYKQEVEKPRRIRTKEDLKNLEEMFDNIVMNFHRAGYGVEFDNENPLDKVLSSENYEVEKIDIEENKVFIKESNGKTSIIMQI